MREGFLFPGAILLILMVLFSILPVPVPESSGVAASSPLRVGPPSLPYSQETPITYQWSGGQATSWIQVLPCQQATCSDIKGEVEAQGNSTYTPLPVQTWDALGYGASGELTIWVPTNQSMMVVTNDVGGVSLTVTWNEMPELSLFWEILTVIGILLCIAGMVLPAHGAPRGHHRRLSYSHWRHHPFALPPHLPSTGLVCSACGLSDIPQEDDFCPRCHAPLPRASSTMPMAATEPAVAPGPPAGFAPASSAASVVTAAPSAAAAAPSAVEPAAAVAGGAGAGVAAGAAASAETAPTPSSAAPAKKRTAVNRSKVVGQSLSVADADPMKPWRVVRGLGFAPDEVLVFTREDPQVLEERYHLDPHLIFTVTRTEAPQAISPGEGDKIADLVQQHLRAHAAGAVVLTDPNYIVTHVGFESLQRLVHALQDEARECRGTFILAFNPQVLSPEQRAHLEERMRKVL